MTIHTLYVMLAIYQTDFVTKNHSEDVHEANKDFLSNLWSLLQKSAPDVFILHLLENDKHKAR